MDLTVLLHGWTYASAGEIGRVVHILWEVCAKLYVKSTYGSTMRLLIEERTCGMLAQYQSLELGNPKALWEHKDKDWREAGYKGIEG
ncbi:MAG: hypothetical protein ACKPKO_48910, partial [Candidatus Fonsibacter sp.]